MLVLLLALTAQAGAEEDFFCAEAQFTVAVSNAGLMVDDLDEATQTALRAAKERAAPRAYQCQGWEVPHDCVVAAADAAIAEANARMARTDAAQPLANSKPLPTLGSDLSGFTKLVSRIDNVLAVSDRAPTDIEDLQAKRAQAVADSEATIALIAARHADEATFAAADQRWIEASTALNRARCAVADCTRAEEDRASDPACPTKPHSSTGAAQARLREAHAATGAALARLAEDHGLPKLRARLTEAGAQGERPSYLEARAASLWRLHLDSAARPATEHARIGAVLARTDGLGRMSPAFLRWANALPAWFGPWKRALDKIDPASEKVAEAWANADRSHGNKATGNANDKINSAKSDFKSLQPGSVPALPTL